MYCIDTGGAGRQRLPSTGSGDTGFYFEDHVLIYVLGPIPGEGLGWQLNVLKHQEISLTS